MELHLKKLLMKYSLSLITSAIVISNPLLSEAKTEFKDCPECPIMLEIPAGDFSMGSPETEERAITLQQLGAAVWTQIERRCAAEKWEGSRPGPPGGDDKPTWTSVPLEPATVCLYDVDTYIIRPATVSRQCSFVELVALAAQLPISFVSHWCAGTAL